MEGDQENPSQMVEEEKAPPERPGMFFKPTFFAVKDLGDYELVMKPIFTMLLESLFCYERVKGEKTSKDSMQ